MKLNPIDGLLYLSMKVIKRFDKRDSSGGSFSPSGVKTILIISSTALGDTLMSTPAIKAVRVRYPEAHITACLNIRYAALFAGNPHIDAILPYYGGYRKFIRTAQALRRVKPDLALIFHGNEPQATPLAYMSGAKFIFKIPISRQYGFLLSNQSNGFDDPWQCHAIDVRLKTASFAGCGTNDREMVLNADAEDITHVKAVLAARGLNSAHPIIGLQPGAAQSYKAWPKGFYAELGSRLLRLYPGAGVVITGSGDERRLCGDIAAAIGKGAVSLAGALSVKQLAALVKVLSVLVTNDTGTMHIAIALGTKTVSLFCPSNHWGTGALTERHLHRIISAERPCSPCVTKKCKAPYCMSAITVDAVLAAVTESLKIMEISEINENSHL
ncbi:MAG: glycosyltransferase family 9 protein [Nitrospirae bacterium]|nr:glycosyltransferase family 9 protein [Nitrospirota bacterium]